MKKTIAKALDRYRVSDGSDFRLRDHDAADRPKKLQDNDTVVKQLADGVTRLSELQTRLFAADSWSILMVLQAMDAAGKDSTIKHVMSGVNPQGVNVTAFKQPGPVDTSHGFLWRVHAAAPMRGRIAIFNRSHYEDVLVSRVHPELLDKLNMPDPLRGKRFWKHRLEDIVNFETYLAHQGTVTLKFFLNVSKSEQKKRFLKRIDEPSKNWKFSTADLRERDFWDAYQEAYQHAIEATACAHAPWYVIPADDKPYAHLMVAEALIAALEQLELKIPAPPPEECARLAEARKSLEAE